MTVAPVLTFTDERFHATLWAMLKPAIIAGVAGVALMIAKGIFTADGFALILAFVVGPMVFVAVAVARVVQRVPFKIELRREPHSVRIISNGQIVGVLPADTPYRVETRVTPDEYLPGEGQSRSRGFTLSRDIFTIASGQAILISRSRMGPDEALTRLNLVQAFLDAGQATTVPTAAPAAPSLEPEKGFSL